MSEESLKLGNRPAFPPLWKRALILLGFLSIYAMLFPLLFGWWGGFATSLTAVPVLITAWYCGPLCGTICIVAASFLNVALLQWMGVEDNPGQVPRFIVGLAIVFTISRIRSLSILLQGSRERLESEVGSRTRELQLEIESRKRAEALLEEKVEEFKRSNRALEQFSYLTSHDLQEPLGKMELYLKFLDSRHKEKLDPEAKRLIGMLKESVETLQSRIREMLSRSQVGGPTSESHGTSETASPGSPKGDKPDPQ